MTRRQLAVAVLLIASLSACSQPTRAESVFEAMRDELSAHEDAGSWSIDLDTAAYGDWDRVVVLCPGASIDDVETALGFSWSGSREVDRLDFAGAIVFANQEDVEFVVDITAIDAVFYVFPCPSAVESNDEELPPLVLERAAAVLPFVYSHRTRTWNLALVDYRRLQAESRS